MTNAPANTARTGRHLGGRYLWLACHLCLGLGAHRRADGIDGSVSATQLASGEDRFPEAIPSVLRPPHPARRGGCGLRRSRLLCLLHVSFADHARRNRRARTLYQHRLGDLRLACLWSNLYGGKLADKGHGVEPLTHIRPIYCVQAVCLCLLAFASLLAVGTTTLLRPYVER